MTPVSHPEQKAEAQLLNHPGIPQQCFLSFLVCKVGTYFICFIPKCSFFFFLSLSVLLFLGYCE